MFQKFNHRERVVRKEVEIRKGNQTSLFFSIFSSLFTFFAFILTCSLIPSMLCVYFGLKVCRGVWLRWLENRYPGLDFIVETPPRAAVDTRRNQGIITLLIGSDTHTNLTLLTNAIQGEVSKVRRLRQVLTSRWGRYAWVPRSEATFRLDNHVSLGPQTFKGRPLSNANIQEYVSDIVSKLLPPDSPPWQIILINTQAGDSYLLIRLHHLYVSMEKVSLGDLLIRARSLPNIQEEESLLKSMFTPPVVIPQIYEHVCETASNWCNEAVSRWDPIENPLIWKEGCGKAGPGLVLRLACVSLVAWWKGIEGRDLRPIAQRRGLTPALVLASSTPRSLISAAVSFITSTASLALSMPFSLLRDAPVYLYWLYLAHYAAREIIWMASLLYKAPRILLEELVVPEHPKNVHRLQTLSLCGRKAVCWSEPVDLSSLEALKRATSATTPEILIAATAASLHQYFEESGGGAPESLMTSCRVIEGNGGDRGSGGVVVLPLPLGGGDERNSRHLPSDWLEEVRKSLSSWVPRQAPLFLASSLDFLTALLPALVARAALYVLSRRYTVGLTLLSTDAQPPKRRLLWGPMIQTLMYWRPPQANACLSLTLMSYGGEVRLGVMSDAQLSPHQATITKSFPHHLRAISQSYSHFQSHLLPEQHS